MAELERFKAETRLHVVTELLRAQQFGSLLDAAVEQSEDRAEALDVLIAAPFGFDPIATEHVLDRTLGQRTRLGVEQLVRERDELLAILDG